MSDYKAYQIAKLVMNGYNLVWFPGLLPYNGNWYWTKNEDKFLDMEHAFSAMEKGSPSDGDTIPSPPNPEVELHDMLHELCEWHNDMYHVFEEDGVNGGTLDEIPHDLIRQIAERINYIYKDIK